jgi:hypothetical protein
VRPARKRDIYINLAVRDLPKSKAFFAALGFEFNPKFTDGSGGEDVTRSPSANVAVLAGCTMHSCVHMNPARLRSAAAAENLSAFAEVVAGPLGRGSRSRWLARLALGAVAGFAAGVGLGAVIAVAVHAIGGRGVVALVVFALVLGSGSRLGSPRHRSAP